MNEKALVNELKQKTGTDYDTCVHVINAYETYCTEQIKRPFQKNIDDTMIDWVCASTGYDRQKVSQLLNALVTIVRNEVKSKIPFVR